MKRELIEKIIAILFISILIGFQLHLLLLKPQGGDIACYGLAAGNWVMGRSLVLPQFGGQYEMDKIWHFNSPLLGYGPGLVFKLGDVGYDWYIAGCVAQLFVSLLAFFLLNLKITAKKSWPRAVFLTIAFLSTRTYMCEFLNQRYSTLCYITLALLFYPFRRTDEKAPTFQWLVAGVLPLLHPALLPASVVWVLGETLLMIIRRDWLISIGGLSGFLAGVGCSALWYLDPHGLKTQFLPHLQGRDFVPFSGWEMGLSRIFALPSLSTHLLIVVINLTLAISSIRFITHRPEKIRLGVMTILVLALDASGRMFYLSYYLIGMAPAAISLVDHSLWRDRLIKALALLGFAQLAVEYKMFDPTTHIPASRAMSRDFLVANTRSGDHIVVGPPFVLSAASDPVLPQNRTIEKVVPMPIYLKDFNQDQFLNEIRQNTTVYIGSPEFFKGVQLFYKPKSPPIFENAEMREISFQNQKILVARPARTGTAVQ